MAQSRGSKCAGGSWSQEEIDAVWNKGQTIPGREQNVWRKDTCGALIKKSEHGEKTEYGWEIDHIKPCSKDGTDDLSNLQPLHWINNNHKDNNYPNWDCKKRH